MMMKSLHAFFLLFVVLIFTTPIVQAQTANPAGVWTFDAGNGADAVDSSGNGHNGTLTGEAKWADGLIGPHALVLPGNPGSTVDISGPVLDTTKSYTAMAWVKLDTLDGYQTFVSIDGNRVSGFYLQLRGDSGDFAMTSLPSDDAGDAAIASSQDEPDPNVWYHMAGVYDASAGTVSLYVDGVLQNTVPFKSPWQPAGNMEIGRAKFDGHPVDAVHGTIDDVRVYQSALSADEIRSMIQEGLAKKTALLPIGNSPARPNILQIQADQVTANVSPTLYGMMTEEVNHSYDGGLYAELIQNRAFQDDAKSPVHWSIVQDGGSTADMALDASQPLSSALKTSLKLTVTAAPSHSRAGIANDGYWGIPVMPNTPYHASFYAKAAPGVTGPITVDIESTDGTTLYAQAQVHSLTTQWQKYTVRLRTGKKVIPTENARFVLTTDRPGTVWFNLVSLFPPTYHNRANGTRPDLMQKMDAMKPAFLRLPGGNYLEGNTIAERFDWEKTLHDLPQRPGHQGPWGYRSTDGMGLLEFLKWCEELHMQPLLAVYGGYSLGGEHVVAGPELTPFVQSALNEIEYATGDTSTQWGAQRARDGHPKSFQIDYVEVGNEDFFDRSGSYDGRFAQFYDAIKAKYPKIKVIATTHVSSRTPDIYDDHFYPSPRGFERDTHHYDSYDRKGPKIFVGEWASESGSPTPDLNGALGDAAWMTGMERNSDVVVLSSYAPLFVNINHGASQWGTNLIGYDALHSYGSPSYYAQVMFRKYLGDEVVSTTLTGDTQHLLYDVTRTHKSGTLYLKMVNPTSKAQTVQINLAGISEVDSHGTAIVLKSASPKDTNTLSDPTKIVPVSFPVTGLSKTFSYQFVPYSITVLQVEAK